jgi:hypothetical protein
MAAENLLGGLLGLALFAFVGRVILSWLPPGEPGYHRPAKLPATWAASHLLGLVTYHTLAVLLEPFPMRITVLSLSVPFALLALVRWFALPGAMVPRASRPPTRSPLAARVLLALIAIALLVGPTLVGDDLSAARGSTKLFELHAFGAKTPLQEGVLHFVPRASLAALAIFVLHALEAVGVSALVRRLAVALLLTTPALWTPRVVGGDEAVLLMLFGAGCASALVWQRCADPRALVLAAIAFAAAPAYRPAAVPLGAAGLFVLCATTHANARKYALLWSAGALVLTFPPWHLLRWVFLPFVQPRGDLVLDADVIGLEALAVELGQFDVWGVTWAVGALAALAGLVLWARRARARRGVELPALIALVLLAVLLHLSVLTLQDIAADVDLASWGDVLLRTSPGAVLVFGLALGVRE